MYFNIRRIQQGVFFLIRASIFLAILTSFLNQRWSLLFSSSLIFLLTFLPNLFENKYKVNLPEEFELIIILFIYASLFLGEIHTYYTKFWWWDVLLHSSSAIALSFAGFLILYTLYSHDKIQGAPFWIAVFTFSFGMALGGVWEIFEFGMDQIVGTNMQKSGLIDTMGDLIVDAFGAFFVSLIGYYYLKGKKAPLFTRFLEHFQKENPKYFK